MAALACLGLSTLKSRFGRNAQLQRRKIFADLRRRVLFEMTPNTFGCYPKVSTNFPVALVMQTKARIQQVLAGEHWVSQAPHGSFGQHPDFHVACCQHTNRLTVVLSGAGPLTLNCKSPEPGIRSGTMVRFRFHGSKPSCLTRRSESSPSLTGSTCS